MIKTNEYYSQALSRFTSMPEGAWVIIIGFFGLIFALIKYLPHSEATSHSRKKISRYYNKVGTDKPEGRFAGYKSPTNTTLSFPSPPDLRDPKQQMEAIAHVDFEIIPLLNREESRLLPLLESCVRQVRKGHRVMAQTSLGEIIRPKDNDYSNSTHRAAYASINSKRLDFAIFDKYGRLALAIEYQGSGHYHAKSFMRDAVKREVLRKAGVTFLEVSQDFQHNVLTRQVLAILNPTSMHPEAAQASPL